MGDSDMGIVYILAAIAVTAIIVTAWVMEVSGELEVVLSFFR